jgi:hypothetical protein
MTRPSKTKAAEPKGITLHLTLASPIFKRLYRLAHYKGVSEQELCRIFISNGLDAVEGRSLIPNGNSEDTVS